MRLICLAMVAVSFISSSDTCAILERDAAAKRVRQRARLIVNLFEHEMRIAALLCRYGVPGNFFDRPLDGFALAVEQAIGAERHFADFAVFEKCHLARVVEQRRNVGSDESFALAPADHNRRGIFCHDKPLADRAD